MARINPCCPKSGVVSLIRLEEIFFLMRSRSKIWRGIEGLWLGGIASVFSDGSSVYLEEYQPVGN